LHGTIRFRSRVNDNSFPAATLGRTHFVSCRERRAIRFLPKRSVRCDSFLARCAKQFISCTTSLRNALRFDAGVRFKSRATRE
jgi:hypothetical protein